DCDWLGVDLVVARMARRGRCHEEVDALPDRARVALRGPQCVKAAKGVGRGHRAGSGDDRAHRRLDRLRMAIEQGLDDGVALGNPGSAVELLRDRMKRREIDRHDLVTELAQRRDGALVRRAIAGIAMKDRLAWNADAQRARVRRPEHEIAVGVAVVAALDEREDASGIGDADGEDRYAVDAAT